MKVIVQRYKDRKAAPSLKFIKIDEFEIADEEFRSDETYRILNNHITYEKYGYLMQFWSMKDGAIVVVLDDRTEAEYAL